MSTLTGTDRKIDLLIGDLADYIFYHYWWSDDLPNHLMWLRLILSPVQLVLLGLGLARHDNGLIFLAMVILTIQAFTDLLDGYIARKHECTSASGARWDPLADKSMVLPSMALLILHGRNHTPDSRFWTMMLGYIAALIVLEIISIIWYFLNPGGKSNSWGKYKLDCEVLAVWLGMLVTLITVNGNTLNIVMAPFIFASVFCAVESLGKKLLPL